MSSDAKGMGLPDPSKMTDEQAAEFVLRAGGLVPLYLQNLADQKARNRETGITAGPFGRPPAGPRGNMFTAPELSPYARALASGDAGILARFLGEASGIDMTPYLHQKGEGTGTVKDKSVAKLIDAAMRAFGQDETKAREALGAWAKENAGTARDIYAAEFADAARNREDSNFIHSVVAPTVMGIVAGPAGPLAGTIAGGLQGGVRGDWDPMAIAQGAAAGYGGANLYGKASNWLSNVGNAPTGSVPGVSTGVTTPANMGGLTTAQGAGREAVTGAGMRLVGGAPIGANPLAVAGGATPLPGVNALPTGGKLPGTNINVGGEPPGSNWLDKLAEYGGKLLGGLPQLPATPANVPGEPAPITLEPGYTGGGYPGGGGFPLMPELQASLGAGAGSRRTMPGNVLNILAQLAAREVFV